MTITNILKSSLVLLASSFIVYAPDADRTPSYTPTMEFTKKEIVASHTELAQQPKALLAVKETTKTQKTAISGSGACEAWMSEAGIAKTPATTKLILNESGCKPNARNSKSGACGIPQAYPCSKLPCQLNSSGAVCQLKWMDGYVKERYGSWDGALRHWNARVPVNGKDVGNWY